MELRPAAVEEIAAMRESRRRGLSLGLVPGFYDRLVGEAVPHLIVESEARGLRVATRWVTRYSSSDLTTATST